MPPIDARLAALGLSVRDVAETTCEGCEGEWMLKHDATCYEICEQFDAEVTEKETDKENNA